MVWGLGGWKLARAPKPAARIFSSGSGDAGDYQGFAAAPSSLTDRVPTILRGCGTRGGGRIGQRSRSSWPWPMWPRIRTAVAGTNQSWVSRRGLAQAGRARSPSLNQALDRRLRTGGPCCRSGLDIASRPRDRTQRERMPAPSRSSFSFRSNAGQPGRVFRKEKATGPPSGPGCRPGPWATTRAISAMVSSSFLRAGPGSTRLKARSTTRGIRRRSVDFAGTADSPAGARAPPAEPDGVTGTAPRAAVREGEDLVKKSCREIFRRRGTFSETMRSPRA